ncbi:squalene/phytoene synthase family protein [Pseudaeromonas sharmana]|uniref:Squalene/phytoene synthase family protein n=1 Tax=Pseudaeromonas sharmana TaxID=328412 RepID=A0ABV8CL08_9GAMM
MILTLEQQMQHLQHVSRSFALTIPLLPPLLADWVGHAYLLCRIVDTLEDDPALNPNHKCLLIHQFLQFLASDNDDASLWAHGLTSQLHPATRPAELSLLADIPAVLARYRTYPDNVRNILLRGVRIMGAGMVAQQHQQTNPDQLALDRYCYAVAGVVGELLTDLFCVYVPTLLPLRDRLLELSVSFGEGLQLTNILKDLHEDASRGVCWLPLSCLTQQGLTVENLSSAALERQSAVLCQQLALAHGHLQDALQFCLLLPRREQGMRQFCLIAIAMAFATLQRIHAQPDFRAASEVKITRRQVRRIVLACRLLGYSNTLLRRYFSRWQMKLPLQQRDPATLWHEVSHWQNEETDPCR